MMIVLIVSDITSELFCFVSSKQIVIQQTALETLAALSDGDARGALNGLETVLNFKLVSSNDSNVIINENDIKDSMQRSHMLYDRAGKKFCSLSTHL